MIPVCERLKILSVSAGMRDYGRLECQTRHRTHVRTAISMLKREGLRHCLMMMGDSMHIYFSKRDPQRVALLHQKENKDDRQFRNTNRLLGRIYGYPDCCIDAFIEDPIIAQRSNTDIELTTKSFLNTKGKIFSIYLNPFTDSSLVFHMTHSLVCGESKRIAKRHLGLLDRDERESVLHTLRQAIILDELKTFPYQISVGRYIIQGKPYRSIPDGMYIFK